MSFIAGHFTASFNSSSIGGTREGFRIITTMHHQPVISDAAGEMQVDGVQQGADVIVECDYIDYDSMSAALFTQTGGQGTTESNVGKLFAATSGLAKSLVLTSVAGTPAAGDTGSITFTFAHAIPADDIEVLLASKLRQGRMRFRCFPDPTTGVTYTTT